MSSKGQKSRYIFFGTPDFALIILKKLVEAGIPPIAVVCNPDRPAGRKGIITSPPTKVLAEKYGIEVLQPENVLDIKDRLLDIGAYLFVVAAYAKIIPKEIIEIPPLGTIGVHPSLLPRHRGASPIQNAILSGDKITGTTIYKLDDKVDHGPILAGKELKIEEDDNYVGLEKKLATLGGELLTKILPKTSREKIEPQIQNEEYATYTEKFETKDAFVDLKKDDPIMINRKVRALNPEPGVWTTKDGKRMKILEAKIENGKLIPKKIQFEGKKPQAL